MSTDRKFAIIGAALTAALGLVLAKYHKNKELKEIAKDEAEQAELIEEFTRRGLTFTAQHVASARAGRARCGARGRAGGRSPSSISRSIWANPTP